MRALIKKLEARLEDDIAGTDAISVSWTFGHLPLSLIYSVTCSHLLPGNGAFTTLLMHPNFNYCLVHVEQTWRQCSPSSSFLEANSHQPQRKYISKLVFKYFDRSTVVNFVCLLKNLLCWETCHTLQRVYPKSWHQYDSPKKRSLLSSLETSLCSFLCLFLPWACLN